MHRLRHDLDVASCFMLAISVLASSPGQAQTQLSARTDTMQHVRSDTATLQAQRRRADSTDLARQYRLDSIADAASRRLTSDRRLYYGLAAGLSQPVSDFQAGYTTGWNLTMPVGWDFAGTPFGLRADVSWDRLTSERSSSTDVGALSVWSLNADATMRHHVDGLGPTGTVYLLGGGGVHRIVASMMRGPGTGRAASGFATSFAGAPTRWGFNGGVGASVTVGQLGLFVETRYIQFRSGSAAAGDARFLPMILGVTF